MVLGTFSTGLINASIRAGMNFSISLFETNAVALVSDSRAAFLTSALVSQIASARIGTISGMSLAVWAGALITNWLKTTSAPVLICHLPAVLICSSRRGNMSAQAHGFIAATYALTASTAAVRTAGILSANASMSAAQRPESMKVGSRALIAPSVVASTLTAFAAPSRAAGDFLSARALMVASANPMVAKAAGPSFWTRVTSEAAAVSRAALSAAKSEATSNAQSTCSGVTVVPFIAALRDSGEGMWTAGAAATAGMSSICRLSARVLGDGRKKAAHLSNGDSR